MSTKDEKNEDRAAKLRNTTRSLQKKAAQLDAALSKKEQEENNRLLALRIEERKTARPDMAVADVIKDGTPEEKAILHLKNFDMDRMYKKGFLSDKEQRDLVFSFDNQEDKAVFFNYLKLFGDIGKYTDKLSYTIKMYEVEIGYLSKLIDKYEAISRDIVVYEILYGSRKMSDHTGMSYNLIDRDKKNMKRLDDTTPEALLAEINEKHKDDGVIFRANVKGELKWGTLHENSNVTLSGYINTDQSGTLFADIDFKGGLYDQIKEQAKETEKFLSFVKAYIEPIEEYINENYYYDYVPSRLQNFIDCIKEQEYSRSIIAKEYHLSYINDKRSKGEEITKLEEYEAFVPDYRAVKPHKEVMDSCVKFIKDVRNEQPKF